MIRQNLALRLERLEDSLPPVNEDPTALRIICVSPDGQLKRHRVQSAHFRSRSRRGFGEGHRQATTLGGINVSGFSVVHANRSESVAKDAGAGSACSADSLARPS